jgi:adenylyl cyclase-associated protein
MMTSKKSAAPNLPMKAPPAAETIENVPLGNGSGSGMAAVMKELVSGEKPQLRKVTDDMKTKNRKMDVDEPSQPHQPATKESRTSGFADNLHIKSTPVCEIQRSNWVVENYNNHPEVLKLSDCTMKQIVYVSKCINTTIYVDCKVKCITLDGCKKVNLIVNSVISSVELVNCERTKIHAINELPSMAIDKCSGVSVVLSQASLDCAFTTSKSSEMNVSVPIGDEGDYKEMPIPEQYVHRISGTGKNSRVDTKVSDLYQ